MGIDITGLGSVFDFGGKLIDKLFPDKDAADKAKIAMLELTQKGELQSLAQEFELAKGQQEINKIEAASSNVFVSGWRPALGWVCVSAYAFNYLMMPLANWGAKWFVDNAPAIVALDTGELTTLLFGMLGIGALRTAEKLKGVASK
jgi:hypothetical protein